MQVRFGLRLAPLVNAKLAKDGAAAPGRPRNLPMVLQVRTKCSAVLAIASTSKQPQLRKNKPAPDDLLGKKNSKRIKVSDDKAKWKPRSDEAVVPWCATGRLEKKHLGEVSRRLGTAERRKKPKPK